MSAHEVGIRQAAGWWPSLVQAVCECGWHGPVRNMNDTRERVLVKLDASGHAGGQDGER